MMRGIFRAMLVLLALPALFVCAEDTELKINDSLFAKYRTDASHVYYWPIVGPGGAKMTRAWPMESVAGEEQDHPHQRSFWIGHGDVNGHDFWSEEATFRGAKSPRPLGKIIHKQSLITAPHQLVTAQDWMDGDGTIILHSSQAIRVAEPSADERLLDGEIVMSAVKQVKFGDTKEGTFALRIAESMRLRQSHGPGKGQIYNSAGDRDAAAWGKRAQWTAMSGPIDGKDYTIVFMDHPGNPGFPNRWHARDYGLFALNPFCEAEMDRSSKKTGGTTLAPKEQLTFKFRILFLRGTFTREQIEVKFREFSK